MSCPSVVGHPRLLLRLEGVVLFAAGLWAFDATGKAWWLVPAMLFLPDLFMVGYARSAPVGAVVYNLAHSYPLPAVVGAAGVLADDTLVRAIAVIWFAHIGMDRALGYGLKYVTGFHDTHLGHIGRPARPVG